MSSTLRTTCLGLRDTFNGGLRGDQLGCATLCQRSQRATRAQNWLRLQIIVTFEAEDTWYVMKTPRCLNAEMMCQVESTPQTICRRLRGQHVLDSEIPLMEGSEVPLVDSELGCATLCQRSQRAIRAQNWLRLQIIGRPIFTSAELITVALIMNAMETCKEQALLIEMGFQHLFQPEFFRRFPPTEWEKVIPHSHLPN
ncbi:unnamed protein product [Ilex paraguariensis]|uniref:Uncharacterized protein n=1 Tax=Ilex paraguariensis TaxID=185542 RepID=A0ABC8U9Y5_9AQUA